MSYDRPWPSVALILLLLASCITLTAVASEAEEAGCRAEQSGCPTSVEPVGEERDKAKGQPEVESSILLQVGKLEADSEAYEKQKKAAGRMQAKHRRFQKEAESGSGDMKYLLDADSRLITVKVRHGYPHPQNIHANPRQPEDYSVCLTSTPVRVGSIQPVVDSIMNQKPIAPSRVILSVANVISRPGGNQTLNEADLGWTSQDKYRNRLVLHRMTDHDFGPATKVLGCLEVIPEDKNTCLVVTDDDMQRPQHWVQLMLHQHSCVAGNNRVAGGFEDGPGAKDMVHGYRGWAIHRSLLSFDHLRAYWSSHRDVCYYVDDEMMVGYLHKNCLPIDTLYSANGSIPTGAELISNDERHNSDKFRALSRSSLTGGPDMAQACSSRLRMESGSACVLQR